MADKCANCGATIGDLETPFVWRENVVCADCYTHLNGGAGTSGDRPRQRARSAATAFGWESLITMTCPSCGGKLKVSPDKTRIFCEHCGGEHLIRRADSGALTLEPVILELREIRKEIGAFHGKSPGGPRFACPRCGNQNIQKVSLAIESGTQEIRASSTHFGAGLFGPAVGTTETYGVQQSRLVKRLPRRPKKRPIYGTVGIGTMSVVWAVFMFAACGASPTDPGTLFFVLFPPMVLTAGGLLIDFSNHRWNKRVWQPRYNDWQRQYVCTRCGEVFVLGGG